MPLDAERLRAKLSDIHASIERLHRLVSEGRESFLGNPDSQDIARSRLLTAMEAALGICYHTCAKTLGQVPEEYAQCFQRLGEARMIPPELAERLAMMARFRNRLVHIYWDIDYRQVFDFLPEALQDLEQYARHAARWL